MKADEQRTARRDEILALQRLRKGVAEGFDDIGRISVVAVVNRQRLAAVTRRSFDRGVRLTDPESSSSTAKKEKQTEEMKKKTNDFLNI